MTNKLKSSASELIEAHSRLINRQNESVYSSNGIYQAYQFPVITREHVPLDWRHDFNLSRNPFLMERMRVKRHFQPRCYLI